MIIIKQAPSLKNYLNKQREKGKICGFVPTMGALHPGHLSLVNRSKKETDITIVSIFLNPLQFNSQTDLEQYPQTIEKDILLLSEIETDVLFLPDRQEMYPDNSISEKVYDLAGVDTTFEGRFRPGHFQGVCHAVNRLLDIVEPDKLYLGQKDYQQIMVIKKLVKQIGSPVEVIPVSTKREAGGLAMSSRNLRLSADEKRRASEIYKQLMYIKTNRSGRSFGDMKDKAIARLTAAGIDVEYLELAQAEDLKPLADFIEESPMVLIIAAYVGEVRLIDNLLL